MGRPLKQVGNEGDQNKVGAFNQSVKMGSALLLGAQTVDSAVTSDTIVLPDSAKAFSVIGGFASAGTVTGAFTPASGAPATTEIGINATGDLIFNNSDAVTQAEVVYLTVEGDVVSASAIIASGEALLPNTSKARLLLSATADGNSRTVVARASAPAAGEAAVNTAGTAIAFNAADNGLSAVVNYIETPEESVADRLTSDVDF